MHASKRQPRTHHKSRHQTFPICVWNELISNYKLSPLKWQKLITSIADSSWEPNVTFTNSKLLKTFTSTSQTSISFMWSLLNNIINVSSTDKMAIENSTKVWSECSCLTDVQIPKTSAWRINKYKRWARLVSSPSLCCTNNIYNHIHFLSFMMNVCMCLHGHFEGC